MNLFGSSLNRKRKLSFGFATVLFVAAAILFVRSKGTGFLGLSALILLGLSLKLYRPVSLGLVRDVRARLPHVKGVKILGFGSLLAACATYIFTMRSTATWPVYLLVGLSAVIPGLCWIYITVANWR
ncbi:MAG TPA: hypothetical protein VJU82_07150, partial [Acidobacteriaceae bacterium]|nr:hypothetical protein [Acidobacteriaceae bacterium]